ncbi:MAG: hypothetical protein AAFY31_11345, partial [Pseudomonadota bacterium]
ATGAASRGGEAPMPADIGGDQTVAGGAASGAVPAPSDMMGGGVQGGGSTAAGDAPGPMALENLSRGGPI